MHFVLNGFENGNTHSREIHIHIDDQRVPLTGVGNNVVAVHQELVVIGNLSSDAGILDSCRGRDEGGGGNGTVQTLAQVLGNRKLTLEFADLALYVLGLVHVECGCGIHGRHEVLALELGDVTVHARELRLYIAQTVLDEVRGALCHLVLVKHPVLVVDGDDHIDKVISPHRRVVRNGKRQHVRHLLRIRGGCDKAGGEEPLGRSKSALGHNLVPGPRCLGVIVRIGIHYEISDFRVNGVPKGYNLAALDLDIVLADSVPEFGHANIAVGKRLKFERH